MLCRLPFFSVACIVWSSVHLIVGSAKLQSDVPLKMIFSTNVQHIPRCPRHIFRSQLAEEHLNLLTNSMWISLKVINLFVLHVMLTSE